MTKTKKKQLNSRKTRKIKGGRKSINCSPTSENSFTCYNNKSLHFHTQTQTN